MTPFTRALVFATIVIATWTVTWSQESTHYSADEDVFLREKGKKLSPQALNTLNWARKLLQSDEAEVGRIVSSSDPMLIEKRLYIGIAKLEQCYLRKKLMLELLNEGNQDLEKSIRKQDEFYEIILNEIQLLDIEIKALIQQIGRAHNKSTQTP